MSLFGKGNHYNHNALRRYVASFGSLFSDLYILRGDDYILVPIKYKYGNMYDKAAQDETRDTQTIAKVVPAMAFSLVSLDLDETRETQKYNNYNSNTVLADNTSEYTLSRTPYNIGMTLDIRTKNIDDMLQIVEQILGVFRSDITISYQDTRGVINIEQDIVVSLDGIDMDDNMEDYLSNRYVSYQLSFTVRGYLYGKTFRTGIVRTFALNGDIGGELIRLLTSEYKDPEQELKDKLESLTNSLSSLQV